MPKTFKNQNKNKIISFIIFKEILEIFVKNVKNISNLNQKANYI